ncbi:TetR/AcrR family transcriptional regulator [Streptomyces sp. TM32]|uniref:TetR/AcrR family transcriptional regulator n=1 Tax=Streptomyces sp. TM32 TaxID=1652669 RepID=UPI0010127C48|nr:TetR/AcrR family transcriptional regulator [Streptomyces sp. TM32]RXS85676.1 TetR/AcrR family transcriptional regulator [Streptomyces sp. TM32]
MVPAPSQSARQGKGRPRSRLKILAAAKALFLQDGYDGVNLDRVAAQAEVARQTVYNQFGSKEAVFRAVMEHHWSSLPLGDLLTRLEQSLGTDGDPAGFLRQFSEILRTFIEDTDQVAFTRLVIAESRRSPWVSEEFYRVGKEPLTKALADCLQRLHETGQINCPSPELAAHQFLGLIQEFIIWPKVMAIGPDVMSIPPFDVVVEEGIAMFLNRYGVRDGARTARPV